MILSLKDERYSATSARKRFYFFCLGVIGLLLWAGSFAGLFLPIVDALLPW